MGVLKIKVLIFCFQMFSLVFSKDKECSDPNAELRLDSSDCILTCRKRSIMENPASCFRNHTLTENCYCKEGYYLDQTTKKCVTFQDCSCNTTNNDISRFSNKCGDNCKTFHTLTPCCNLLRGQCWCDSTFCRAANGTCIPKEI